MLSIRNCLFFFIFLAYSKVNADAAVIVVAAVAVASLLVSQTRFGSAWLVNIHIAACATQFVIVVTVLLFLIELQAEL